MKETFYFSHDYNARDDEKISNMLSDLGMEGYGIYWSLIEILAQNNGKYNIDSIKGLSYKLGASLENITRVITHYNLFITQDNNNIFYNKRLQEHIENIQLNKQKKSQAGKKGMEKRWNTSNENITRVITDDNSVITKYNKLNKIKLNKNKINNNNINNNIIKINSKELTTEVETFGNEDINKMQEFIKKEVESIGYIYKSGKQERNRIKNILTAKQINEIAEKHNMTIYDFVGNIFKLSNKLDFWNGKINNAETFYKHYDKIYNEGMSLKTKKNEAMIDYGTL